MLLHCKLFTFADHSLFTYIQINVFLFDFCTENLFFLYLSVRNISQSQVDSTMHHFDFRHFISRLSFKRKSNLKRINSGLSKQSNATSTIRYIFSHVFFHSFCHGNIAFEELLLEMSACNFLVDWLLPILSFEILNFSILVNEMHE